MYVSVSECVGGNLSGVLSMYTARAGLWIYVDVWDRGIRMTDKV